MRISLQRPQCVTSNRFNLFKVNLFRNRNKVEIKFRKTKCFHCCCYITSKNNFDFYLAHLKRNVAFYSSNHENFLIIGDLNSKANNSAMSVFSDTYDVKSSLKSQPVIRTPMNFFLLANQDFCVIERGLFEFDRMTVIVMK